MFIFIENKYKHIYKPSYLAGGGAKVKKKKLWEEG